MHQEPMSDSKSRRDFLRSGLLGATAAGAVVTGIGRGEAAPARPQVERRVLGRTGASVSILGLGLGSAFTNSHRGEPEATAAILEEALGHGINYWDTARVYGPSEEMIGPAVEKHRDRIFLVSKSGDRTYDGFKRDLETSLRNLRTDHIDLYHLHSLEPGKDADLGAIERGALRAAREAREQGVIRHLGITGHSGAAIHIAAIKAFDPDCLLTIFPCTRPDDGRYEDELLPLAVERGMGVIAMKMVRRAREADLRGTDLIRYALSLPGVATGIVGLDTRDHLAANAAMASAFTPLSRAERLAMHAAAGPRLAHVPAPWDRPGYADGAFA